MRELPGLDARQLLLGMMLARNIVRVTGHREIVDL